MTRARLSGRPRTVARMTNSLTYRQRQYLRSVAALTAARGYPPTFRELGAYLGVSSTNAVAEMLARLEQRRLLTRGDTKSRSIVLTWLGREEVAQ